MRTIAKSYLTDGNLTRGDFGDIPRPIPVEWDSEHSMWLSTDVDLATALAEPDAHTWGAWDVGFGYMAPWPADDVQAD